MRPLIFLTVRSFLNGLRRALTSARRLIGLVMVVAYYGQFIFRSLIAPPRGGSSPFGSAGPLEFRLDYVEAGSFLLFACLSTLLFVTSLSPRGGFRAADIDVLFATPLNPKIVLYFRIARDYLISLFVPLFVAIVAVRPVARGVFAFFRNFPEKGAVAGRLFSITYLLLALCWVCIGYTISLYINRSDEKSDRNKKLIEWSILIGGVAVIAYVAFRFRSDASWDTAIDLSQNPFLRIVFFTATAASAIVLAPFHNNLVEGIAGFGGLFLAMAISMRLAIGQVGFMYDQAAARGFKSADMYQMQRKGDTYGMVAEQFRRGKRRPGKLAAFISRWTVKGGLALIWKELILQARGASGPFVIVGLAAIVMVLMPLWATARWQSTQSAGGSLLLFSGISVLMLSVSTATGGFIELLRRGDLQKPLPFSPAVTVFWEVAAKSIPIVFIGFVTSLGSLIIDPRLWLTGIGAVIMGPSLALAINSVGLLVILLFPDVDDASQRGFRGLMLMLGTAIAAFPAIALAAGLFFIHVPAPIIAVPFLLINAGVAFGICLISGGLYGTFNPSE